MTCAACTVTNQKSLTQLEGVAEAEVTLKPPQAIVKSAREIPSLRASLEAQAPDLPPLLTVLTQENVPLSDLYFVIEGSPEGMKDGVKFRIKPGEFVGEVGFMLDEAASATVTLPKGGLYMRWDTPKLRRMINERPQLARAFEALIGRDMARKVAGSIRLELVERDPVLPALAAARKV